MLWPAFRVSSKRPVQRGEQPGFLACHGAELRITEAPMTLTLRPHD